MRFFGLGGNNKESQAAKERRETSQRSLEAGGLPLNAIDRLREQATRQNTPKHFFTSDLSVSELALTHRLGYEPLGQVMGSSIYHVGWQGISGARGKWFNNTQELTLLTEAYYNARHLALGRLKQEAILLGATGVVGVRIERKGYEWGPEMLEFAAIGTAIRETGTLHREDAQPFLSALSGEEFYALRQVGYRPVGFALGNCVYVCVPNWRTQSAMSGSWKNQELKDYTGAVYEARSLAMERMESEAREHNALGIVGVKVEVDIEPIEINRDSTEIVVMLYFFDAWGTSVMFDDARAHVNTEHTVSLG